MAQWPTFFLIGAGKSGTTSLYEYLKQHPQLFLPAKDPGFFALAGMEKTLGYDEDDPDGYFHFPGAVTDMDAYLALYKLAGPDQVSGDATTMYMYKPGVIERMQNHLPEPPKCIAILRQPAERLFSRYVHLLRENRVPADSFESVFDPTSIWWKKDDLVQEGFYYRHLKPWYDAFPRENLLILLYDEFKSEPLKTVQRIFSFLDVDDHFEPNMELNFNPGGRPKRAWMHQVLYKNGTVGQAFAKTFPSLIQKLKSSTGFMKMLYRLRSINMEKQHLDPELRPRLTHDIYGEDLRQLETLIGQDLSHWLE